MSINIPQIDLDRLIADACNDYVNWSAYTDETQQANADNFLARIEIKTGKKYLKVVRDGSAWAFIVNVTNDAKFSLGDILKPANWATPTRNAERGNVLTGYHIKWTGPEYLR